MNRWLAIIVCLLTVSCAAVEPQPICELPLQNFLDVDAQREDITIYSRLTGGDAVQFMRAYNSTEPVSDVKGDEILAFAQSRTQGVYLVIAYRGCVVDHAHIPLHVYELWSGGRSA